MDTEELLGEGNEKLNKKIWYHDYDDGYVIEYICKIHRIVLLKLVNFIAWKLYPNKGDPKNGLQT